MVLVIRSSKNRTLSIAINKNQHLIGEKNYNKISLILGGDRGVDFVNFFQKLNPPPPGRGGGVKFTEQMDPVKKVKLGSPRQCPITVSIEVYCPLFNLFIS